MTFLLDTNVCIVYLNQPQSTVATQLHCHQPQDIAVCSVVKAELFFGAMKSQRPEHTLKSSNVF